ncbi:MAG TPA: hypothetical protein PKU89_06830, partial [Kiritimatiellia bacterium]|nr:hypothetical protein [Kiritimatiellia bacterium]
MRPAEKQNARPNASRRVFPSHRVFRLQKPARTPTFRRLPGSHAKPTTPEGQKLLMKTNHPHLLKFVADAAAL